MTKEKIEREAEEKTRKAIAEVEAKYAVIVENLEKENAEFKGQIVKLEGDKATMTADMLALQKELEETSAQCANIQKIKEGRVCSFHNSRKGSKDSIGSRKSADELSNLMEQGVTGGLDKEKNASGGFVELNELYQKLVQGAQELAETRARLEEIDENCRALSDEKDAVERELEEKKKEAEKMEKKLIMEVRY